MGVGETITVINKSGKVSKHVFSVFKEAKAAYRERKAEIKAERDAAVREKKALSKGVEALRDEDDVQSHASSRRSSHSKATHRSKSHHQKSPRPDGRPPLERGYTDSFYANDRSPRTSRHRFDDDLAGSARDGHMRELVRRNSDQVARSSRHAKRSEPYVDMDLAYGDVPPPLPDKKYEDAELKEKASKITMLLDEANCLQYSATAMIENLQKNPDALAAVSLTLAEISAIVSKMGPGVLTTLKGGFPAVAALLMSPQFMIAGGVAVGVTIVALGGYKIIKRIQQNKDEEMIMGGPVQMPMSMPVPTDARAAEEPYILDELETKELSRIDLWRRGIADVEAESSGCSVDGEFITPGATRQLVDAGVLDEDDIKSRRSAKIRDDRSERPKSHRAKSVRSDARSEVRSERSAHTSKTSGTHRSKTVKEGSSRRKEKEPSLMKTLFRSKTAAY
ncbi:uncharacterized protein M421DRAFT_94923 [Didymella exigua CBS 183.55]|uniref:Uncharacterized protein n=1 Tax=Didymella exigua CBS 183.55 TaxID=1150837 RepID=A0A6A5RDB6_9PLEO|nr:uncharacterized protein M421DRAFT_94923 [Didymella exigua CBS 183.55]KAF1925104.1 hypothetical protein M421DRAFT_94923 [Didymella exigua CBS 183.55]